MLPVSDQQLEGSEFNQLLLLQKMFKEEKPVWWPLDTWDSKALDRGKAVCEATLDAMRKHFNVAASTPDCTL